MQSVAVIIDIPDTVAILSPVPCFRLPIHQCLTHTWISLQYPNEQCRTHLVIQVHFCYRSLCLKNIVVSGRVGAREGSCLLP